MSRHLARVLLGDQVWIVTARRAYRVAVSHPTGAPGLPLLRTLPADQIDTTTEVPAGCGCARWATALDLAVRAPLGPGPHGIRGRS